MTETTELHNTLDKSGAPPCGLYLRVPAGANMDLWQGHVRDYGTGIKHRSGFARNMHAIEIAVSPDLSAADKQGVGDLIQICESNGLVAILSCDDSDVAVALAKDLKADGVITSDAAQIQTLRGKLGNDAIIGLHCGFDLELGQQAHKDGADYATFGEADQAADLSLLMKASVIDDDFLCAALGPFTNDNASYYTNGGVHFLDCTSYSATHEESFIKAIINMLYAISLSLENNCSN